MDAHLEQGFQVAAVADVHDEEHVGIVLKRALKRDRARAAVQRPQSVDLPPQPLQQLLPADSAGDKEKSRVVNGTPKQEKVHGR